MCQASGYFSHSKIFLYVYRLLRMFVRAVKSKMYTKISPYNREFTCKFCQYELMPIIIEAFRNAIFLISLTNFHGIGVE